MKKIILGLTTVALTASLMAGADAKPSKGNAKGKVGRGNHGSTVSSTARNKEYNQSNYKNHGQRVSSVAKTKGFTRKYRTKRVYNNRTGRYEKRRVWSYYDPNRRRWIRE